MTASRPIRAVLAIALATVLAPALTGCLPSLPGIPFFGGNGGNPVGPGVETPEGVDLGDVSTSGGIPADFPTDAIPVVAGEVSGGYAATTDGKRIWTFTVVAPNALGEARDLIVGAGFTLDADLSADEGGIISLSNTAYAVTLFGSPEGLLYTVAEL